MIRTNIMLTPHQHSFLKEQSHVSHRTIGELVRDAVDSAFLLNSVEHRRQVALAAYQEGFISIGKLAETLGLDPASTRLFLKNNGVIQKAQDISDMAADAANA